MKRKEKGWKKAVVLMLALIMCISSIVVPQPEEVSAKAANRIDFKINGKAGSKVTLYAGEYVKFTIDGMWQNGDYIQTSGTNAYGDKINFKPSKELTYKSSNNAVATVTNKGVITAKKKGTCKITVTSIYNAKVINVYCLFCRYFFRLWYYDAADAHDKCQREHDCFFPSFFFSLHNCLLFIS